MLTPKSVKNLDRLYVHMQIRRLASAGNSMDLVESAIVRVLPFGFSTPESII